MCILWVYIYIYYTHNAPQHAPTNRRSPPHYAPTEPVPPPPPPPPPPHTHTSVCVCVVVAAAASSSRREPNTLFWRMHSQPNSHRAKQHETGSSLGHTAPVWPAPTRDRSRVGGHKGECPVGDLLNSPNRGRKDTVQNGSGLPIWAYFFFSRPDPSLYIYFRMVRPV